MPGPGMGGGPGRRGQQPKLTKEAIVASKGTFFRLLKFIMKRYALQFIVVMLGIIGSVLCNAQGTMFTQSLIDDYIFPMVKTGSTDFGPLLIAIRKVAILYGVGIVSAFMYNLMMVYIGQGTLRDLRNQVFDKMETLPLRYFDSRSHGDIMSVYTNDIDTLRQMISQSLPQFFNSAITIVTVLVCMIRLSWQLTIVAMLMVWLMLYLTKVIASKSGKYFMAQQKDLGALNGQIEEIIGGQKVVKVFCHEAEALKDFKELNNKLRDTAYNANRFSSSLGPINAQLGNVSYVVCAIVGGLMAFAGIGKMTLGSLVSFLTFNRSFNMPINQVSQQLNSVVMAMAGAKRIFDVIDEQPEADDGYVTLVYANEDRDGNITESKSRTGIWAWKHYHEADGTTTYKKLRGDVEFDDVDFGYVEDKTVLHNIVINATPGKKVAFVGATGAGKTTITNLINRFYDVSDGKIRYDGININKIKKDDLRKSLGIVLQDTHLFTGTVAENIKYGKLDATDAEVKAAAVLANADAFIRKLPQGYDTMLTKDGANLSQGQRQLLAIARAAIADPPVLILDEATSSIDTRTEKIVQSGMDKLMKGRTVFVIAHRLSTIRNSDVIMVLDQGRIIESGNHDELIAKEGKYYQLYTGKIVNA